jgi:thymidylate synthase
VCGLEAGAFVHTFGDAHLYSNHLDQANLQLTREPMPLPQLKLNPEIKTIDSFTYEDIEVVGYEHHPHISAPIAI